VSPGARLPSPVEALFNYHPVPDAVAQLHRAIIQFAMALPVIRFYSVASFRGGTGVQGSLTVPFGFQESNCSAT
jgi:hypothetical protein